MNVDLIKALDARGADAPRGDGAEDDGEFPDVFESTLSGSASKGAGEESEARSASSPSADADERAASGEAGGGERVESRADDEDEVAEAEAAAESGAVGGASGGLEDRARLQAESERLAADRLDLFDDARGGGRTNAGAGLEEGEALDEEQAREAVAQLEDEGSVAADGDEASASADAAIRGAVASGVPQASAGVAEGSAELAEAREGLSTAEIEGDRAAAGASGGDGEPDEQPADRQETPRSDAALFERAAENAPQAEVDSSLRQAAANAEQAQRAPEVVAVDGAPAVANPVAGQVTETTSTATPGSPQPVAASEAIAVQTEWLATRGGGVARMVLHPPDLGEIAIRVSLRGGAVDVVMVAQEAVAQGVAEEQSERLAQAFSNRDLRLENFEVRRGAADDLANDAGGRFAESETERDGRPDEESSGGRRGLGRGNETQEAPIAVPRILTRAPETGGVDLRI